MTILGVVYHQVGCPRGTQPTMNPPKPMHTVVLANSTKSSRMAVCTLAQKMRSHAAALPLLRDGEGGATLGLVCTDPSRHLAHTAARGGLACQVQTSHFGERGVGNRRCDKVVIFFAGGVKKKNHASIKMDLETLPIMSRDDYRTEGYGSSHRAEVRST